MLVETAFKRKVRWKLYV